TSPTTRLPPTRISRRRPPNPDHGPSYRTRRSHRQQVHRDARRIREEDRSLQIASKKRKKRTAHHSSALLSLSSAPKRTRSGPSDLRAAHSSSGRSGYRHTARHTDVSPLLREPAGAATVSA